MADCAPALTRFSFVMILADHTGVLLGLESGREHGVSQEYRFIRGPGRDDCPSYGPMVQGGD